MAYERICSSGQQKDTLHVANHAIGIAGNALLSCYSKRLFSPHLKEENVNLRVWTTGLMRPEAYTLHDAIAGFVSHILFEYLERFYQGFQNNSSQKSVIYSHRCYYCIKRR